MGYRDSFGNSCSRIVAPAGRLVLSTDALINDSGEAICDFVHQHIKFGYGLSSPTKSAFQAYQDRQGVRRDFAHLAVTLCRCMNIPARYCTGGARANAQRLTGDTTPDLNASGSRDITG